MPDHAKNHLTTADAMDHPSVFLIQGSVDGRIEGEKKQRVLGHLKSCRECASKVSDLGKITTVEYQEPSLFKVSGGRIEDFPVAIEAAEHLGDID